MADLFINPDGAGYQAQAVLAYLRQHDGVECSWSTENKRYLAKPKVDRWHNCREQGYVIWMSVPQYPHQVNIAFFEHRNSDSICALVFEANSLNPPTLADIPKGVYETKWDTSHDVGYGEAAKMADWIYEQLESFWKVHSKEEVNV